MVWFPPAKINLGLHVLRKRPDGFHDLETCFYPINWTDILEIIPEKELKFTSTGLEIPGNQEENLCIQAYNLIHSDFDISPVHIHLHKLIPMGAGLGGGSSDAAFTLQGLNQIFELQIPPEQLHVYASKLGSDCPFFLNKKEMLAKGRGDELMDINVIDLKGYFFFLVYPQLHIPTAAAYQKLHPKEERSSLGEILEKNPASWKDALVNDFEESIFREYPLVESVKDELYSLGAVYASMSGSGSAVYGIFEDLTFKPEELFPGSMIFAQEF